jgi:hypothetical protein
MSGLKQIVRKRRKGTLLDWAVPMSAPQAQSRNNFLRRFFSKKRRLAVLTS